MESLEDLHEFYDRRGIDESTLKRIAIYIEKYSEALFDVYDIEITEDEIEVVSIRLYKTLLHQGRSQSMELEIEAEEIIQQVLHDFEDNEMTAFGNLMAIIGKAGTIDETRHPKITELGVQITEDQMEGLSKDQ